MKLLVLRDILFPLRSNTIPGELRFPLIASPEHAGVPVVGFRKTQYGLIRDDSNPEVGVVACVYDVDPEDALSLIDDRSYPVLLMHMGVRRDCIEDRLLKRRELGAVSMNALYRIDPGKSIQQVPFDIRPLLDQRVPSARVVAIDRPSLKDLTYTCTEYDGLSDMEMLARLEGQYDVKASKRFPAQSFAERVLALYSSRTLIRRIKPPAMPVIYYCDDQDRVITPPIMPDGPSQLFDLHITDLPAVDLLAYSFLLDLAVGATMVDLPRVDSDARFLLSVPASIISISAAILSLNSLIHVSGMPEIALQELTDRIHSQMFERVLRKRSLSDEDIQTAIAVLTIGALDNPPYRYGDNAPSTLVYNLGEFLYSTAILCPYKINKGTVRRTVASIFGPNGEIATGRLLTTIRAMQHLASM